jgi:hypothetical protein
MSNCNANGICKLDKCFCYPGYSGKFCEIKNEFLCPPFNVQNGFMPCNGNGLCKFGMCFCFPGFKGDDCGITEKCKNDCSWKGICVDGKCVCKDNDMNEDCSKKKKIIPKMKFKEIEQDQVEIEEPAAKYEPSLKKFIYSVMLLVGIIFLVLMTLFFNKKYLLD